MSGIFTRACIITLLTIQTSIARIVDGAHRQMLYDIRLKLILLNGGSDLEPILEVNRLECDHLIALVRFQNAT